MISQCFLFFFFFWPSIPTKRSVDHSLWRTFRVPLQLSTFFSITNLAFHFSLPVPEFNISSTRDWKIKCKTLDTSVLHFSVSVPFKAPKKQSKYLLSEISNLYVTEKPNTFNGNGFVLHSPIVKYLNKPHMYYRPPKCLLFNMHTTCTYSVYLFRLQKRWLPDKVSY